MRDFKGCRDGLEVAIISDKQSIMRSGGLIFELFLAVTQIKCKSHAASDCPFTDPTGRRCVVGNFDAHAGHNSVASRVTFPSLVVEERLDPP